MTRPAAAWHVHAGRQLAHHLVGPDHTVETARKWIEDKGLQHPVGVRDYAALAWFTSSAAVLGGALGSGPESDEAVQRAAHGNRTPPTG